MKLNTVKTFLITILPYIAVIVLGSIFLILSCVHTSFRDLWIGLAGTSYSIVLVLLVFDIIKYYTDRYLNIEIYRYINLKISEQILRILSALARLTTIDYTKGLSLSDLNHLTDWEYHLLNKTLKDKSYLGFDIFINWDNYIPQIEKILESNINMKHLNSSELLWLLDIYKSLVTFSQTYKYFIKNNFFESIDDKTQGLKVVSDKDDLYTLECNNQQIAWNYYNNEYKDNLLCVYKLNPTKSEEFSKIIFKMIKKFENSPIFKKEMVLDPRRVRKNL